MAQTDIRPHGEHHYPDTPLYYECTICLVNHIAKLERDIEELTTYADDIMNVCARCGEEIDANYGKKATDGATI